MLCSGIYHLPSTIDQSNIAAGEGRANEEIDFYISMANSIKAEEFSMVSNDLETLLGRKRKTLKEYVREL